MYICIIDAWFKSRRSTEQLLYFPTLQGLWDTKLHRERTNPNGTQNVAESHTEASNRGSCQLFSGLSWPFTGWHSLCSIFFKYLNWFPAVKNWEIAHKNLDTWCKKVLFILPCVSLALCCMFLAWPLLAAAFSTSLCTEMLEGRHHHGPMAQREAQTWECFLILLGSR